MKIQELMKKARRHRSWRRVVSLLACVVIVSVLAALTLSAVTMERKPLCGLEEHVHGPECYREEWVLVCGQEETPAPEEPESSPDGEAAAAEAEPDPAEAEPAADGTEQAEAAGEDLQEAPAEAAAPERTVPEQQEAAETPEEASAPAGHVHTKECYELRKVLICTIPEHTHDESCYEQPDPEADVENESQWEKSVSGAVLTGDWNRDLLAVAETQVGYQESSRNFVWDKAGFKKGYTRYGAFSGSVYADWNTAFVTFCLHYARIPREAMPIGTDCASWAGLLAESGLYRSGSGYRPVPGDLVFFDTDGDGTADRMGLVRKAEAGAVETIEGDVERSVRAVSYGAADPTPAGFCSLEEVRELWDRETPAGELTFTYENEKLSAQVTVTGQEDPLPEDTRLTVTEYSMDEHSEAYRSAAAAIEETQLGQEHEMSSLSLFDLQLSGDGLPQQLSPQAEARVELHFREPLFTPETVEQSSQMKTLVMKPGPETREEPVPTEVESSYSGVREGVTDLAYSTGELAPVAVLTANRTQSGQFWKVCRDVQSAGDFARNGKYIIVSVEGGYALTNNLMGGQNYTRVELQPVKGNPDYYTAPALPANVIWTYDNLGGTNRVFYQNRWDTGTAYVNPGMGSNPFSGQYNNTLGIQAGSGPACFQFYGAYGGYWYYLNYNGDSGRFLGSTGKNLLYAGNYGSYYQYANTADMLILRQVDATLTIPEDAVAESGGSGGQGSAQKPSYPAYVTTSGEKTGELTVREVPGSYASDPSTSQLESRFGHHKALNGATDYQAQKGDNGKALMDKSVIYGGDDYGAFTDYGQGEFGVTLSALGQAFVVDESVTKVPLDVMFILDMSNSMNETDKGQSMSRARILVDSVNKTIDRLMRANPENRVGAVGYNSGAYDLMPLAHYRKGANGRYFSYTVGEQDEFGNPRIYINAIAASGGAGKQVPCKAGTYTQMGIAKGYDLLMRNTSRPGDTTYTTTVDGQTVTRPRKPVIILVSDGEPTHCTSHYMDVLRNPYYGDGLGPVRNAKGVQGYYTILSANYYKRMVGIHYNNPAAMYTVAFAMKENDFSILSGSAATSHYRATVMNPTQANINTLDRIKTDYSDQVEKPLYQMLKGSYGGAPQKVGASWDLIPELGSPHCYVPVLKSNPYRGGYAYADKAYLNNSGNKGLDAAFEEIIQLNTVYDFSYETQADRPLALTDPIGEGMELKSDPVLRVNGTNYTHTGKQVQGSTTVYTYSGTVPMDDHTGRTVDLSTIRVRVETADGLQTVTMEIPPRSLPTYTADPTMSFYHEALPIRLTYQVGLSQGGLDRIDQLPPGQSISFYTNRWTAEPHAAGTLDPSGKNEYYRTNSWKETDHKISNPTGTDAEALSMSGNASRVSYRLGNNGRLTFAKPEGPAHEITVRKNWQDYDGAEKTAELPGSVTATLYRTYVNDQGETVRENVVENFILNADNGWTRTFVSAELNELWNREYQYFVTEEAVEGYEAAYKDDGIAANTPETPIVITNRCQYGDMVLPETGGMGTGPFILGGSLLITACACIILLRRIRKERGQSSFL